VFARLNTPPIKLATRSVSLITCSNGNIRLCSNVLFKRKMFIAKMKLLDGILPFPWQEGDLQK
jgi:hypothetical protein